MSQPTPEQLEKLQKDNLTFLETFYSDIKTNGIPVIKCINYKTIQIVNNIGLQSLLAEEESGEDTVIE